MRKIPLYQIVCIGTLISSLGILSGLSTWGLLQWTGGSGLFLSVLVFGGFWYLYGPLTYAGLRRGFPFRTGEILPHSRDEFYYHVFHLPFLFFWLYPPAFSGLMPIPTTRLFYKLFGAHIGENSYPNRCTLFDPHLVTIGENVILGHQSMVIPHIIETGRLAHHPVKIGNNVTIGVNAVILAGTTIGDGAIVGAGSVVPKFSQIKTGEIWAGSPARPIPSTKKILSPSTEKFTSNSPGPHPPLTRVD